MGQGGEGSNAEGRPLPSDAEAEFGGREARLKLEQQLLRKLDIRMSMLVLIYILNYVRPVLFRRLCYSQRMTLHRSIEPTFREPCNVSRSVA
jgi:hypothetical protein